VGGELSISCPNCLTPEKELCYPVNMTHGARAGLRKSGEQKNFLLSSQGFKPRNDHSSLLTDHYSITASVYYVTARGH